MRRRLRLAISAGDPAGIGPEVVFGALATGAAAGAEATVFGDGEQLASLAKSRDLAAVRIVDVGRCTDEVRAAAAPSAEAGAAQLAALEAAAREVLDGRADVLVTGPTSKAAIEAAGTAFSGQTEHLASLSGLSRDAVSMLFLGPRLRVGLVTTHLAVRDAAAAITAARVRRTARHLRQALESLDARGTIAVTGLNPHAGEGGLFGHEDREVIAPALSELAGVIGPLPAEAAFRGAADGRFDGVVAMLHDQATIASKLLDWGEAVNVTWGLPFLRTSVDHGVAYDIAGTGRASASGMRAALDLARRLA
ncbi:MAG: 4-hydroxythreonine-4-phosphate dehydrogenase PdxA [Myxococcota bacterium]